MKEKRKTSRQATVEKIEKDVKDIQVKLNYDGGLVYKCDLEEFMKTRREDMEAIRLEIKGVKIKVNRIYPKVAKDIKRSEMYSFLAEDITGKATSGKFWVKTVVTIIVGISLLVYAVGVIKSIIMSISLR